MNALVGGPASDPDPPSSSHPSALLPPPSHPIRHCMHIRIGVVLVGQSRANPGKPPLRPAQRRQHCLPRRLTLPAERGGRSAYKTASAAAGNPPYPGCRRGFHRCWQLTRARQVGWPHMLSIQRGLRQVPADAARSRAASRRKLHIYSHLNLFAQRRASPRARGCRQDQLRCDPRKRGGWTFEADSR